MEIKKIINILNKGGVVAVPTDTVYGLLADATNPQAVARVLNIKERGEKKGMPIFAWSLNEAKKIALIDARQEKFLKEVWPGKVTIVLKVKKDATIASNALPSDGTIALRIPSHPFLSEILKEIKKPLTGTSANRSGLHSCLDTECIKKQLYRKLPDLVIEGGKFAESEPSTIIDFTKTPPLLLRKGAEYDKIKKLLHSNVLRTSNQF